MSFRSGHVIHWLLASIALLCSQAVFATNGYFSHGTGIKERGLGGAGVAYSQGTLSAASNPAGMVWQGDRWDIGGSLFSPRREYTVDGALPVSPPPFRAFPGKGGLGDTVESDKEQFLVPQFGWNRMLDDQSSFGVSIYGRGGMNTAWRAKDTFGGSGVFGGGDAGVDLAKLFAQFTYARKIDANSSWGISPIIAYQRFEAKGLSRFAGISNAPTKLSDNGHDSSHGYGISVGWQGRVSPALTLGAAYQSRVYMDEFDEYAGLFAEQGDFDIPSSWTAGLAWDVTPASKILLDVQRINYAEVDSVGNTRIGKRASCAKLGGTGTSGCLGGENGIGFGWEDMTVVKVGYQWTTGTHWVWRVGIADGEQPIDSKRDMLINILAPGVMETHYTFGFTRALGNHRELDFSFMFAPEKCIEGLSAPVDDPAAGPPNQTTELCMEQLEISIGFGRKF